LNLRQSNFKKKNIHRPLLLAVGRRKRSREICRSNRGDSHRVARDSVESMAYVDDMASMHGQSVEVRVPRTDPVVDWWFQMVFFVFIPNVWGRWRFPILTGAYFSGWVGSTTSTTNHVILQFFFFSAVFFCDLEFRNLRTEAKNPTVIFWGERAVLGAIGMMFFYFLFWWGANLEPFRSLKITTSRRDRLQELTNFI